MHHYMNISLGKNLLLNKDEVLNLHNLQRESFENPVSPFELNFLLRNETSKVNIMERINTDDFFKDYHHILEKLSEDERIVMQLSYDIYVYYGLTYKEIADFLGIERNKVASIKKRALKHVRNNSLLNKYR